MRIDIKSCLSGATEASGLVIVIDVFRSGNTAAALLDIGVPWLLPVADLEEARNLKAAHPEWLAVGERGGTKPEGFDLNNSPVEASRPGLTDQPVILTTSAGTAGLVAAAGQARDLIMATLVNARWVVDYVLEQRPNLVTLVPIGLEARVPAVEDEVVAEFLRDRLEGRTGNYRASVRNILSGDGAARLRRLNQWADLAYCLRLDRLAVVPRAQFRAGRLTLAAWRPPLSSDRNTTTCSC